MLLAIDISNTSIKVGIFAKFNANDMRAYWSIATDRNKLADDYAITFLNHLAFHQLKVTDIKGMVVSCVVPPLTKVFQELSQRYFKLQPLIIDATTRLPIRLIIDNPFEVGADRMGTAVAMHTFYPGPSVAITFGTATVFDCIAPNGDYLGGAIFPGMVGALESLTRSAAQLYQVQLIKPPGPIGTNTIHMLQSGLIYGYSSLVEGLTQRLIEQLNGQAISVVASGGLAKIIAPETSIIQLIDPHLLLKGLRVIYQYQNIPYD